MDTEARRRIVAWVATRVMPHEGAVRAWLRRRAVPPDDIDDFIQEAYCRMASVESVERIDRPGGYFFQIVRNLLVEQIRRSRIVRFETVAEMESLDVDSELPTPERITAARRELARVQRLIEGLPESCRRVFELRKIHEVPQREIAKMLGITESRVEYEGVRGLRLIMQALREEDGPSAARLETIDEPARNRRRD